MKKPKKQTTLKEDIGKYLLDVNKLVLGSMVLGNILRSELPQGKQLTSGIAIVIVTLVVGLILGIREKKTEKE